MRRLRSSGDRGLVTYLVSLSPAEPAPGAPSDPGLFGPASEAWRVGRERVLLAAGPAGLLLQLAHPPVAAGVAQHSDFRADPFHRLRATLDATLTVVFGDREQATAAVARLRARHRHVTGSRDSVLPKPAENRKPPISSPIWSFSTRVQTLTLVRARSIAAAWVKCTT